MKLDRLLGILTVLMQNDSVTAPQLAERFEVSRRTISRDIDALCRAGIPVATRQGSKGGISILQGFRLDRSVLTADELASIIAALKGIGSVTQSAHLSSTLDKLAPGGDGVISLRESIVIDLASHYRGSLTGKIELIRQAVRQSRAIEFDYIYEKGEDHRRVEPYFVVFQWTAWYVFGYCQRRRDWRMFKLARLWNLTLLDDRFTPREIPAKARDFSARFTDHIRLSALFEPTERYRLIDEYGLECYEEMPDGRLLLRVGYTNQAHILRWLLSFGGNARVLEPLSLAERVRQEAKKILEPYS